MTTEIAPQPPLTATEIQNADTRLAAYLDARIRDYNTHGWGDDGVIETRDGRALMTTHIDITLRRARAAETARDQERAANALMRRTLEKLLRNFYEKGHPGEPCLRSGWVPVREIDEARELLTALAAQASADGPVATPTPPAQSNSSSPTQAPPVTAWDQFCGATIQPGDATNAMVSLLEKPKPCSRRPCHDGPHGNADGVWWPAAASTEPDLRPYDLSDLTPDKMPGHGPPPPLHEPLRRLDDGRPAGETSGSRFRSLLRWAGFAEPPGQVEVTYVGRAFPKLGITPLDADDPAQVDAAPEAANRLIEDHRAPHPETDPNGATS